MVDKLVCCLFTFLYSVNSYFNIRFCSFQNIWGSLKQYLRTVVEPRTIEELKAGIQKFWQTLTPAVCQRYIAHLRKVIPKVIEENGGPSGY